MFATLRRDRVRRRTAGGAGLALAMALASAVPVSVNALSGSPGPAGKGGIGGGASAGPGESPLFSIGVRGNLAQDSSFIRAVSQQFLGNTKLLYANDDGTHTVVVGGAHGPMPKPYTGATSYSFTVLVGPHGAKPSQLVRVEGDGLRPGQANGSDTGSGQGNTSSLKISPGQVPGSFSIGFAQASGSFIFVGEFSGTSGSEPYVVLGPTDLKSAEYATDLTLHADGGKLDLVRTGVASVPLRDGAGAGEIENPGTTDAALRLDQFLAFRGTASDGSTVDLGPLGRAAMNPRQDWVDDTSAQYDPIRAQVVSMAHQNGITVDKQGPGGNEVADNSAQVLEDLALFAGVDPSAVSFSVKWVGRETEQWDSALIEFDAPGLSAIQAFVRGLAPGQPGSKSPGLANSFVRPAQALTPGQLPETAAAFGGTSELSTIGFDLRKDW